MKKFKLIKTYPGSPELGTIISQLGTSQFYEDKNNSAIMKQCFDYKIFSKYPEFWEEVVEKDYEILEYKTENGFSCKAPFLPNSHQFYIDERCKIHSVKRKSDGEVFTIGDKVTFYGNNFNIKTFHLSEGDKIACGDCELEYLQHIKQSLFTTEDGVDIFEGDVVTVVSLKDFEKGDCDGENDIPIKAYSITWEDKIISSCNWNLRKDNFLQFSTKEKAEEYILYNKPLLTLKDVEELLCKNTSNYFLEKFKKRAQKLNNKN